MHPQDPKTKPGQVQPGRGHSSLTNGRAAGKGRDCDLAPRLNHAEAHLPCHPSIRGAPATEQLEHSLTSEWNLCTRCNLYNNPLPSPQSPALPKRNICVGAPVSANI